MKGASGLSYEQAAEIYGCRLGTIRSRVSQARASLKRILEEDRVLRGRSRLDLEEDRQLLDLLEGST